MTDSRSGAPGPSGLAADLQRYLQQGRDTMLAKLDGLGEHDVRRPLVPSGTNLLGLVKHLAGLELGYLGDCVGRPAGIVLPWVEDGSIWDDGDMWARPEETRADLVELYRTAWRHADGSIAELPLDAPAEVPWWPEDRRATTFGSLLVRMVAETAQHAGHADILRETLDASIGAGPDESRDAEARAAYVARVQAAADTFPRSNPALPRTGRSE
jgi:Protein of unknown function (DUF664)